MGLPVYWVNGEADASPTPADRGLSYGDGVFETFRCHRGRIHLWDYHWQRLSRGLAVLGIECSRDRVEDQLGQGKQFLERQGIEHAAGRLTVNDCGTTSAATTHR